MQMVHVLRSRYGTHRPQNSVSIQIRRATKHQYAHGTADFGYGLPKDVARNHQRDERVNQPPIIQYDHGARYYDRNIPKRISDVMQEHAGHKRSLPPVTKTLGFDRIA